MMSGGRAPVPVAQGSVIRVTAEQATELVARGLAVPDGWQTPKAPKVQLRAIKDCTVGGRVSGPERPAKRTISMRSLG